MLRELDVDVQQPAGVQWNDIFGPKRQKLILYARYEKILWCKNVDVGFSHFWRKRDDLKYDFWSRTTTHRIGYSSFFAVTFLKRTSCEKSSKTDNFLWPKNASSQTTFSSLGSRNISFLRKQFNWNVYNLSFLAWRKILFIDLPLFLPNTCFVLAGTWPKEEKPLTATLTRNGSAQTSSKTTSLVRGESKALEKIF